uniref:Uncharacterized protein n=1 Tax=Arundo donax TaxID=35708 RepID=A0A0A9AT75_ARUDO
MSLHPHSSGCKDSSSWTSCHVHWPSFRCCLSVMANGHDNLVSRSRFSAADQALFKKLLAEQTEMLCMEFQTGFTNINNSLATTNTMLANIQSLLADINHTVTGVMNRLSTLETAKGVTGVLIE